MFLVVGNWAAPNNDELQEIYLDTCQLSCDSVKNKQESSECRETFCPNYVNYLLTGYPLPNAKPTHVSTQNQEVAKFCAMWMIHLLEELGWQRRIRLRHNSCVCAASTDCLE